MTVITCPKCGGCGELILGNNSTTVRFYKLACPSCGGYGYVSDTPSTPFGFTPPTPTNIVVNVDNLKLEQPLEDLYLKCPECGKAIKVQLGHYLLLSDTAKKL